MTDIVIASDDLVVLGGPSSISIALDVGATGSRGSLIFSDVGKPTSDQISFSSPVQLNDLYINLNPSDNEYLYLYQYKLENAVLGWAKLLRLVPSTVLVNPILKFINGEAHTSLTIGGTTLDARGLYFPLFGTLETADTEQIDYRDVNVQYSLIADLPTMSSVNAKEINTTFDIEFWNPLLSSYQTQTVNLGSRYLFSTLKAVEVDELLVLAPVNGYRKVDLLVTIGGRSEQALDISEVTITDGVTFPGSLTVVNHGLALGDRIAYLANGNTPITGLTDQSDYYVAQVLSDDNFILTADGVNPVILVSDTIDGVQSILKFGGLV